jgi:hypothetical protein
MTTLASHVQTILQDAGFSSWSASFREAEVYEFEDEALIGFVGLFLDPQALLSCWHSLETAFINKHAARLRTAGEKAWNVYSVFLSASAGTPEHERQVRWIEENLERSRKITACSIQTRDDVLTALLPLLPIVAKPILENEDPTSRLRRRIAAIAPGIEATALDTNVAATDIARLLGKAT